MNVQRRIVHLNGTLVERHVLSEKQRLWFAAAALLVVALSGAGLWLWSQRTLEQPLAANWDAAVITLAGGGLPGSPATNPYSVRFADPFGVAVASDGTAYVSDGAGGHRIYRITHLRAVASVAGSSAGFKDGPGASALFNTPSGLAVDAHGNLFVADTGNDAIRRIAADGTVSTLAGREAGLNGPVGIAVDPRGRVIVADTYNDRIVAIDASGVVTTIAGAGGPGFEDGSAARFHTPCGVAADASGNIYVADTGNGALRVIPADGSVFTLAADLGRPLAVAVATDGAVFAADGLGRIVEVQQNGAVRTVAGGGRGFADGAGSEARFRVPSGIAVSAPGRLIVTDRRNGFVRLVAARSQLEFRPPAPPLSAGLNVEEFARTPLLWPFAPMDGPFEVTGTLGEPRGGEGAERFHAGLDVHAPEGTPVRAVRDGVAEDPLAANDFETLSESLRIGPVAYIHMRVGRDRSGAAFDDDRFVPTRDETGKVIGVRLKRGAQFHTGDVIGTVNRFYHAHINVGWPGEELNPLRFSPPGFEDRTPPVIVRGGIRVIGEDGEPLKQLDHRRLVVQGRVRVVVDAWDQVDGNEPRRRLGLYRLGYQLLDASGRPVAGFEQPLETIRFDRQPLEASAARIVYAGGSGIPEYGSRSTRFLYVVTTTLHDGIATDAPLDTATLVPGDYTIRILAADASGNEALRNRDLAVTIPRVTGG
jgi:DNA-binding beta-propeller fold protein YncE